MVAEPGSAQGPITSPAMVRSARVSDAGQASLGEEIMEAVGTDLAGADLPLGLGVGLGAQVGSNAQEAKGPTGRRTPRTPLRTRGVVVSTPQSGSNLD